MKLQIVSNEENAILFAYMIAMLFWYTSHERKFEVCLSCPRHRLVRLLKGWIATVEWGILPVILCMVNTLRPRQNGCHFADDTFKCISLDENDRTLIQISLKFVPKGPINNIPALVQTMAWCRPGAYMRHSASMSKHIEAKTKWLTFSRQYLRLICLYENCWILIQI